MNTHSGSPTGMSPWGSVDSPSVRIFIKPTTPCPVSNTPSAHAPRRNRIRLVVSEPRQHSCGIVFETLIEVGTQFRQRKFPLNWMKNFGDKWYLFWCGYALLTWLWRHRFVDRMHCDVIRHLSAIKTWFVVATVPQPFLYQNCRPRG